MGDSIDLAGYEAAKKRRKKLWEIGGYNCCVIGTCFNRAEIRKLAAKKKFSFAKDLRDHEIHSALVHLSATRCEEARALHRILDRRYRLMVSKFSRVKTEDSVRKLWNSYLERGSISGPLWAVMTHPATGKELAAEVHGEVHMIGHDFTEIYERDESRVSELETKVGLLEEVLVSERQEHLEQKKKLEEEVADLRSTCLELSDLEKENSALQERLARLENAWSRQRDGEIIGNFKVEVEQLRRDNARLCGQVDSLSDEVEDLLELFELASETAKDLEEKNVLLAQEREVLKQEVTCMEEVLRAGMADMAKGCANCPCAAEECPAVNLSGKTVLYVGGQHKMIPRYRQLVEQHGGSFLHHDGGKETSRSILPKILSRADAVFCPVDCISHDACKCVKKICKRYQKDYVMMRSSGLSSLVRGLSEITQ